MGTGGKPVLAGLVRPGTVVLDIGANVSYYTVALARWLGASGAVYAVEPEPGNFEVLRVNAVLLGLFDSEAASIHLFPFAASDRRIAP
jgi:FkbM family methyltransferase